MGLWQANSWRSYEILGGKPLERIGRTAHNEVGADTEQQSVARSGVAADAENRKEKGNVRRKVRCQAYQAENDAAHNEIEDARLNKQVHASVMIPQYIEDQVMLVMTRRRYKTKSAAYAYVLNRGLETIARELNQPDRIEDMVVRTEHMSTDSLALLRLLVSHLMPDIDLPEFQIDMLIAGRPC